jgi:hypothetical protein
VLLFGLALFFVLLVVLRVCWDHRPEKQKQGSGAAGSNELHGNHPPLSSQFYMHTDDQSV